MKKLYIISAICFCLIFSLNPALADLTETELNKRILLDYNLSQENLYKKLKTYIPDLSQKEFDQWLSEERFENIIINGQKYFFSRAVQNLFWKYKNLNQRNIKYKNEQIIYKKLLEHTREIKKHKIITKRFSVYMQIDFLNIPKGLLKAWLPIPDNYTLMSSLVKIKSQSSANAFLKAVYLETNKNPTSLWLKYNYKNSGVYFKKVLNENSSEQFLAEKPPHIVFTPEMLALSKQIIKNPKDTKLQKAQKIYNWIAENINYSFAPEYSTIANLSQTCLINRAGDCGQAAFLFITLCRINNIPARWQSGVWHFKGKQTIHDWAAIYIEPTGWLAVDPYMGMQALQYSNLPLKEKTELKDFYFGGIDSYRLITNTDHNIKLNPVKCSNRSDEVDFQRGEFEVDCQNIYFDQFKYNYSFEELF